MTRVATVPLQRVMAGAMGLAQEKLAITQQRIATGKRALSFADLGTETVRNLSTHTMMARQDAQSAVGKRMQTTLSLYQSGIEGTEDLATDLKQEIINAIGTGKADGLQETIEAAFSQFRNLMNADEGGLPLFAGSQTDQTPFVPITLADAAATPTAQAFTNDNAQASARVADGVDVTYGIGASALGSNIYEAFRTLAAAGPIGDSPTAAQLTALNNAIGQLDTGLEDVRAINAENGRKQAQVDTLVERGGERTLLLKGVIQQNEDADLGQVAIDLSVQQQQLQATYSVFSQLNGLSLVNFL